MGQAQEQKTILQGWGRLTADPHRVVPVPRDGAAFPAEKIFACANGRSYGDAGLNPAALALDARGLDRFLSFDPESGVLWAEAGVLLGTIQRNLLPQGWVLPVTPGTQFVTLGGAVANDVHGKNHGQAGSFGCHVTRLDLWRSDAGVVTCSAQENPELFAATIGGMGLTGIILRVGVALRRVDSGWMATETVPFSGLPAFFNIARSREPLWEYGVGWLDCTRADAPEGVYFSANHSQPGAPVSSSPVTAPAARLSVPFALPVSAVNPLTLRLFNSVYLAAQKRKAGAGVTDMWRYFYPLDAVANWNRLYGRRGFYQYQSVIPWQGAEAATAEMLAAIAGARQGSFLMVLKLLGDRAGPGMMGFAMPGVTLAMDFPNRGDATERLFQKLDTIVLAAGGRLYPAKDARMPAGMFRRGYPRLDEFLKWRDPSISTAMSCRLMGW
ncbi:FAD-binding oxidoreductase [Paragemmobacter straminiformis]|uniref:FAD-binding oxidoreductase n=1 Tax=Paragemmobacter straminiformis TaxID=2045119 RepID=A0A842IA14_9RHOB|nr:FAD-binding oxidoreductase [Gemmobacter straminiformis]MBC2836700.1 FAD-binding oxidoreductase [Gemmobacter straminiformis]